MASQMFNYLALMLRVFLSHHQSCKTSVSASLWSRALLLWSGDTCLWCPHTLPQSGLLNRTNGTQKSIEDRRNMTHHTSSHFILFINLFFCNRKCPHYLTILSIVFGNKQAVDWNKSRLVVTGNKVNVIKCNSTDSKTEDLKAALTFAWWAREAPALAELLSLGCWFLQSCSLWRCTPPPRPHCGHRTPQICKCLHRQREKVFY